MLEKILVDIQSKNLYEKNDLKDWANQKPTINSGLKESTKTTKPEKATVHEKKIKSESEESTKKNRFAKKKPTVTRELVSNEDF